MRSGPKAARSTRFHGLLALAALFVVLLGSPPPAWAQQEASLLAEPGEAGVRLRWTLPDAGFPDAGFTVERADGAGNAQAFTVVSPLPRAEAVGRGLIEDEEYGELVDDFAREPPGNPDAVERRDLSRATWTLLSVTRPYLGEVLGTVYEDTTVAPGSTYTYRVTATVDGIPVVIGEDEVTAGDFEPLPAIDGLTADVDAIGVHLRWELPEEGFIVGYKVYRTGPDGSERNLAPDGLFVSRSEDPATGQLRLPAVFLQDTEVTANTTYEYVVIGLDVFGRETPRSDPLSVFFPDPEPLEVPLVTAVDVRDEVIELYWTAPRDDRVVGIGVLRYLDPQGEPALLTPELLPAAAARFADTLVTGGVSYYYSLVTVDAYGRQFGPSPPRAARAVNLTPPSAPSNLELTSTEAGLVLSWDAPPEQDVRGYQVFIIRAEETAEADEAAEDAEAHDDAVGATDDRRAAEGRHVLVTDELIDGTAYTLDVPAGTLDEFTLAVRAVNTSFVEGRLSNRVSGRVIDIVPPDRPILSGIRAGDGEVSLSWAYTTDPDVAGYRLLRQIQGEEDFILVREDLTPRDTVHADTDVTAGLLHVYTLEAIDASGNISERASPLAATPYRFAAPDAPGDVEARMLEEGGVEVRWEAPASSGVVLYVVERQVSSGRYVQASDPLLAETTTWVDPTGRAGLAYRVVAIDAAGNAGRPSQGVLVRE